MIRPGIGRIAAAVIITEIGTDMSRFPTPGHLVSWAKLSPAVKESARKKKKKRKGAPAMATLCMRMRS